MNTAAGLFAYVVSTTDSPWPTMHKSLASAVERANELLERDCHDITIEGKEGRRKLTVTTPITVAEAAAGLGAEPERVD